MKRYLTIFMALLLTAAIVAPAFAEVEWKFGGQFRSRIIAQDNFVDANDDADYDILSTDAEGNLVRTRLDDRNFRIDQRLRLYMTAQASQNLKMVVRFEMGDTTWGNNGTGGRMGADERIVEMKNAYIEFKIPQTPVTAIVGVQPLVLMNSWIADDDFSAAVVKAPFGPVTVAAGYIAGQNQADTFVTTGFNSTGMFTNFDDNIDAYFMTFDYAQGPFSASLVGIVTDFHKVPWGPFPGDMTTPTPVFPINTAIDKNLIADIGINLGYKIDFLTAYVTFIKNLGSMEFEGKNGPSMDYTGWMVDAGATYFCGPWTFNLGGFYTTGQDIKDIINGRTDDEWHNFTYPATTSKYFSEIVGGGILDNMAPIGNTVYMPVEEFPGVRKAAVNTGLHPQWSGYQFPSNIWTVTAGASWQVLEKTKLSLSYWYLGTSEDVLGYGSHVDAEDGDITYKYANDIGHEINFYVTQGIVDGLTLDLVAAYLITGDAYSMLGNDNVYELGARLQWNF